jgi:hypothetical protein
MRNRSTLSILGTTMCSVILFLAVGSTTGRIEGRGADGVEYVSMLTDGVLRHSSNERLRPLVVWLNWPLYVLSDRSLAGAIDAFASMNVLYVGWLTMMLLRLAGAYGASRAGGILVGINVALCVATSKYFSYYPTLIDLGAYAVITTAVYAVVRGWRIVAPVLAVMAVLSREFGGAVALFGIHREIRMGRGVVQSAARYTPAIATAVIWRYVVARLPGPALLSPGNLADNMQLWRDVQFVALFLYFVATVFGGISMLIVARAGMCVRFLYREPEWITYAAGIVAMAALGNADIWRYLAYLLPCIVVLFAWCDSQWTNRQRWVAYVLIAIATLLTQRPLESIDSRTYFSHWFPYYVIPSAAPDDLERLWLYWGRLMLETAVIVWLLGAFDLRAHLPPSTAMPHQKGLEPVIDIASNRADRGF